jgi:Spy/CpxP family protein refolding chaperone
VDQIVDEESKKFGALQKQIEPQFQAVREDTRNRIRQILTPEQLSKFNELARRVDERRKHRPR